ncbi:hypothetical protein FIBSPDRAFT_858261 [Athelia psychrophila]|uniref:Cytochrome b561 domain-containing protein n=1 Tax=Athelia psychrophila TaxID=1759441 RepID=A0A166M634_9AGAM|nr:hypothetical protein FIBSPDRAFT_858261 [Fibularhizoctonia sp. CBS 109695]
MQMPTTYSGPPESSEHERLLEDPETLTGRGIQRETDGRKGDTVAKSSAIVAVLVILVTTWAITLSNKPTALGWFALHPTLQTLALVFFTYGILTLQPTADPETKTEGLARHQIAIIVLGFPTIVLGTSFMIYNKVSHAAPHFTTWHSIFGLVAVVWIVLQMLVGAGSLLAGPKGKALYKYHRLSGYLLFPWLLVTVHLAGAWSAWMVGNTSYATSIIVYTVAPAVLVVAVYARMRTSKMNFTT